MNISSPIHKKPRQVILKNKLITRKELDISPISKFQIESEDQREELIELRENLPTEEKRSSRGDMLRQRSKRSLHRSSIEQSLEVQSPSPMTREAKKRAEVDPELKLLKDQFESGLAKVKPTVLYAYRTMDPTFEDQKVG